MPDSFENIFRREVRKAEMRTLLFGQQIARTFSSGPFRLPLLKKLGHPYSTANPRPPMAPWLINVQSGLFRESWVVHMYYGTDAATGVLVNESPEADFLEDGTTKMIKRPIIEVLEKRLEPYREQQMTIAFNKSVREALGGI